MPERENMSFLQTLFDASDIVKRVIDYGGQCKDGSHDHRTNKGSDRTPAQKIADALKRK